MYVAVPIKTHFLAHPREKAIGDTVYDYITILMNISVYVYINVNINK